MFDNIGEAESVRVIIEPIDKHPACEHGPALLFERRNDNECQRFYACAAYRDQNECPLYIRCDKKTETMPTERTVQLNDIAEKSKKLAKEKTILLQKVKKKKNDLYFIKELNEVEFISDFKTKS